MAFTQVESAGIASAINIQSVAVTGVITATSGFVGNLTGNTTGTHTGGVVGDVTAPSSVTVGQSFIRNNSIGLGVTTNAGRDAGIATATGTIIYNSSTGALELYDNGWITVKSFFLATGGTVNSAGITPGNGYRYHVFTSPGTFTVNRGSTTVEYLVVAGGGGGGTGTGGGGGAGGVRYGSTTISTPQSVTVGTGGASAAHLNVSNSGSPSNFGPISATGGGRGASGAPSLINSASPGGSGGGGMSYPTATAVTAGTGNAGGYTPAEGNAGGPGPGSNGGGGGGGAGSVGTTGPGGPGGSGLPFSGFSYPQISSEIPAPAQPTFGPAVGANGLYGGGGGGSSGPGGSSGGPGGGGGGNPAPSTPGNPGVRYTGGGGGANWSYSPGNVGGGGGDGIVIIRYLI